MPRGTPDIDWRTKPRCPRCGSRTQSPHACHLERIAELEAISHSQKAMLDEIAEAAGFCPGDTYSAASIVDALSK